MRTFEDSHEPPDWAIESAEFVGYVVSEVALNHRIARCKVWECILSLAEAGSKMEPEQHWEF